MNSFLEKIRTNKPLVHCITNYVTVNDVANMLIACGASPVMADAEEEVQEMVSIAQALVINIGTLNSRSINSMMLAGKKANNMNIPVVLDPVGAGATALRTKTALQLLEEIHFTAIRGNASEIKVLATGSGSTRGVDVDLPDTASTLDSSVREARQLACQHQTVVVVTGPEDIITDCDTTCLCANGCSMMKDITGSGCMLSALLAAFLSVNKEVLEASAAAVAAMGICGELAQKKNKDNGNASFRNHLIDSMYNLRDLKKLAQIKQLTSHMS